MRKVQSKTLFSIKENCDLILEFSVSYSSCGPILFNFFSLGGGWETTRKKKGETYPSTRKTSEG